MKVGAYRVRTADGDAVFIVPAAVIEDCKRLDWVTRNPAAFLRRALGDCADTIAVLDAQATPTWDVRTVIDELRQPQDSAWRQSANLPLRG